MQSLALELSRLRAAVVSLLSGVSLLRGFLSIALFICFLVDLIVVLMEQRAIVCMKVTIIKTDIDVTII